MGNLFLKVLYGNSVTSLDVKKTTILSGLYGVMDLGTQNHLS